MISPSVDAAMKLTHHYRTLGLSDRASFVEVKAAYRQLVRQYHPDLNPDEQAIAQFIAINEAYTALLDALSEAQTKARTKAPKTASSESIETGDDAVFRQKAAAADRLNLDELKLTLEKLGLGNFQKSAETARSEKQPDIEAAARPATDIPISTVDSAGEPLSVADQALKREAYEQLKALLGQQKFPRAIALIEGLSNRLPSDLEISQWRAIVYQRWGRQLINEGQLQKARIYLNKATQVDPNNSALNSEIKQDLARLAILKRAI